MAVAEKREICELLGVAVNTSALRLREGHEGALDRVAGLGAAAAEVASGADLQGLTLRAMELSAYQASASMRELMLDPGTPDARDVLAGELGPMLWHIRYGGQHGLVPRAIPLFAAWLSHRRLFSDFTEAQRPMLEKFAGRVLHEWLSDRCVICGGSGRLEVTKGGTLIRPRGVMQRNARFTACRTKRGGCNGTGRAHPSPVERARWIGVTMKSYDEDRWAQRFNAGLHLLQLIADRMRRPLTAQLERRKKRF